ncbi:uncharacterized protein [Amphiura filiformis]|uniref:uncharacterized protein n=1 Tax=Amphiura filiformis TaxID=82378 RepID=UPI003B20E6B1
MAGIVPTQNADVDTDDMSKEEKALLICGICRQLIDHPKYLPCLHTFCCKCIPTQKDGANITTDNTENTDVIQCPTCRQISRSPLAEGASSLPNNIIVAKMKDEKLARDKLKTKHAQIQCTNCTRTLRNAVARCVACDDFMCERCLESHNSIRALKQHLVITITEFRLGKVPQRNASLHPDFCPKHKSETLRFYCETCGVAICRDCIVVEHPRPEHRHVDIEEAIRLQNNEIQMLTTQCVQLEENIESNMDQSNKISDVAKKAISDAKAVLDTSVENIKLKFLESLEQSRRQIEDRIIEIEQNRYALIQQDILELESVKSRMNVALTMSTQLQKVQLSLDSDAANVYAVVASALRNVCAVNLRKTDNKLAFIEFIPHEQSTFELPDIGQIRDDLNDKSAETETVSSLSNSSVINHEENEAMVSDTPLEVKDDEIGVPMLSSTRNTRAHEFTNPTIVIHKASFKDDGSSKESTKSLSDESGDKLSRFDADDVYARRETRDFERPAEILDDRQTNSSVQTSRTQSTTSESSREEYATSYADTPSSPPSSKSRGSHPEHGATRYGRILNLGRRYGSMSNLEPKYDSMSNSTPQFGRMAKLAPQYGGSMSNLEPKYDSMSPQFGRMAKLAPKYESMSNLTPQFGRMAKLAPKYGSMSNLATGYEGMTNMTKRYGSTANLAQKYASVTNLATGYDNVANLAPGFDSITNLATCSSLSMDDLHASSLRSQTSDWILERSFGHKSNGETSFAWGVVINNDNDIVVTNQNSLGMSVFGRDGRYKCSVATRSRNRDVLIIGDDYYVTSRTKFVRVYGSNGKFQRQFHAVAPASSSRLLYTVFCMTQDKATGLLVLGASYSRSACLSIHRTDGRHVNSLKIAIEPTFIAMTSQSHFIVSSHPDKLVQILDPSSGLALVTINSPSEISQWFPSGVCCSQFDDIYIANKATDRSRGIYKFTASGELLGCMTTVVASPYGLALTDDDHRMIVADYQSVKVFKLKCH